MAVLVSMLGCSSDGRTYHLDDALNDRLPTEAALRATVAEIGDASDLPSSANQNIRPQRSEDVGYRGFIISGTRSGDLYLNIYVYDLGSASDAAAFWAEEPPERAYAGQITNLTEVDKDEIAERLPMWAFDPEIPHEDQAQGLCLAGWDARGLDGCAYANLWLVLCETVVEVGLEANLNDAVPAELLDVLYAAVSSVRAALPCE